MTSRMHRAPGVVRRAVARVRATPRAVVALALLGFVAALVLVALGLHDRSGREEADHRADSTQQTLAKVADPLAALCEADPSVRARVGDACNTAQQVVEAPPNDPPKDGKDGRDGRGIVATLIRADGHLVVSYTDGARIDVGPVVGKAGTQGRGIVTSTISNDRLILTYSDGTTQDVGRIVGERGGDGTDGRGISSTAIVDGRLIVTYDDGTSQDAGPLPPGPRGPEGPAGPDCRDGFEPVETGEVTGADGTRYSRSITCVDPSSAQPQEGG